MPDDLPMWTTLIANLAVVALFVSSWHHARAWLQATPNRVQKLAFSAAMGFGAVSSMMLAVQLQPGVYIDLRAALIATAALFAGPAGAAVSGSLAAIYRIAVGGDGLWAGLAMIAVAIAVGLLARAMLKGREPTSAQLAVFAVANTAASASPLLALPEALGTLGGAAGILGILAINTTATFAAAFVIAQDRKWTVERHLLQTALRQSPDFQYIKDRECRFVAVNQAAAAHHGFADPAQMHGRTDFDFTSPERAAILMEAERRLLAEGTPIRDIEEELDLDGERRWFSTSKSAIRDADGNVIGLAGVTHDITAYKDLEAQLRAKSDQFMYAVQEMSDGLAMFDQDGVLVLCNDQYRELFPLTADVRTPGTHLRTILTAIAETGEQLGIPPDGVEQWIEDVLHSRETDGEQEIQLFDGRWLRIRTRPTADGRAMCVISDITKIKEAEFMAVSLSDQLRQLVGTDGLTGLLNRRAFDDALQSELARAERERQPASLLMIDVDHFKAYNDAYGHLAGDDCLRAISACLETTARRGDIVARYGGEEFAIILPNTDEAGALAAADKFRSAVRALGLRHERSAARIVTISVGAAYRPIKSMIVGPLEMIGRADAALYEAKAAGRDQVMGWNASGRLRALGRSAG